MATTLDPYLTFDGNASEAMHFYAKVLGGKVEYEQKFDGSPGCQNMSKEHAQQTMHISVGLGNDRRLMASDTGGMPFHGRHGITLALMYESVEEGTRIFNALAEGGKVTMALDQTFWVERFGMLEDKYGTAWMMNCGKSMLPAQP